jgi:hypothetical protein
MKLYNEQSLPAIMKIAVYLVAECPKNVSLRPNNPHASQYDSHPLYPEYGETDTPKGLTGTLVFYLIHLT